MVAHCWRFNKEINWLRVQMKSGKLGKIIRTKGYGVHANWGPSGWLPKKDTAGGAALADIGIHALDNARYLHGDPQPVSVYAHIGTFY
jgi:predicted dehydrogenase